MTKPCNSPVRINPDRNLEVQWRTDRTSLRTCKNRHGALVRWNHGANDLVSGGR